MSLRPKVRSDALSRRYSAALLDQLARAQGASLTSARSLGSAALAAGLDTLDLARIHERALIAWTPSGPSSGSRDGIVRRAASFFVEALKPIANAHRAALRKDGRSSRQTASRRELSREIRRREVVQEALETSERHYRELLEKSQRMQEHLRRLSHEILSAQEEERRKISRELHDEIAQTLTAVNVRLATMKSEATVNTTGLTKQIASTQRLVERSMNSVHRFAVELRPPLLDDLGLVPALHSYMKGFTKQTHIPVRFTTFAAVERLDVDKRTVLYRVAQEAFTNIAKHAQATLVKVNIQKRGGTVRMDIHDNGKSFDVQRMLFGKRLRRLGLIGMRERVEMVGGTFAIESAPGTGTTIRAEIPFANGRNRSRRARGGAKR